MIRLLLRWVLNAVALVLIAYILPGMHLASFFSALVAAIVIGLVSALLRPLFVILTLPLTLITLGLFLFVINALLFWLASAVIPGFSVDGFWTALIGSIIYSILTGIITFATRRPEEDRSVAARL
jgi:putative membrane protein